MGGWSYRIGDYQLDIMDYYYEEFPRDDYGESIYMFEDKTFFDTFIIDCKIQKIGTDNEIEMQIPSSKIFTISQAKGLWYIDYSDDVDGPNEWLFKVLKRQNKKLEITPRLPVVREYPIPAYYLNSDIRDEDIKVGLEKRVFEIKTLAELNWIFRKGFVYG